MHYIEPENRRQASLFSSLDDFVSPDNPVRLLDLIVDEVVRSNPDQFSRRGLSNVGRKAYSPQILLKIYLYGYLHGISSSRKLEAETKRNMELMWLLGRLSPDHKTIADYRKDHGEAIRFITLSFRDYLIDQNYISGKRVALDGTKLKANAARGNFLRTKSLERRIQALESQLEAYLDQLKRNDVVEEASDDEGNDNLNEALVDKICELEEALHQLKTDRKVLDDSPLKQIHRTDPDCRNMRSRDGFIPAYNMQMITDMTLGMIAHAEIRLEPVDQGLTEEMMDNLEDETSIVPEELYADAAYFSAEQLHWLEVDRGIRSWIPVPVSEPEKKDKEAGISFTYQPDTDTYKCSQGNILFRKQVNMNKQAVFYQAKDCEGCLIQKKCTKSQNRSIKIPFLEPWIDNFRNRMRGHQGIEAMEKRKAWVEHPFGTLKTWMGKIPVKLRGKLKVQTEIDLYTTAYNFKRLIGIGNQQQIANQIKSYNWIRV